ncbi:MAG: hypothetical protein Q7W02_10765 [Candidatus Rokubacteria bacterium]|nr:hypothetical protein [Candidatus Rokubacteria bacterium]
MLYHLYDILVVKYWAWILLGCVLLGLAATGYVAWGWALFGVALIWYWMSKNYGARQSNHLSFYIVYLLLDDDIREKQKKRFREWIRSEKAPGAMALSMRAIAAIQRSADVFAVGDPQQGVGGSALQSHHMIWRVKNEPDTVDPRGPTGK